MSFSSPSAAAQEVIDGVNAGRNLVISGPIGCGKCMLAEIISSASIYACEAQFLMLSSDLPVDLGARIYADAPTAIERFRQAGILIIQNVGDVSLTNGHYESLLTLIASRAQSSKPTILVGTYAAESWRAQRVFGEHSDAIVAQLGGDAIHLRLSCDDPVAKKLLF